MATVAVVVLASFSPAQLQSRIYTNRVCAEGLHFSAFSFHSGMVFAFGYAVFNWVWSFHLGMLFAFGYSIFIWVWSLHLGTI